ncbi:hypothetical protein [Micromonospora sp. NPDC005174]|uniref:hypothetical protein n=1 Tax=unclassified Micromonospora TaxID=2617518 RepID=UPI0033A74FC6
MNPAARHASTVRVIGNPASLAGLLVFVMTLSSVIGSAEPHVLAGFLVATGIGLRIEAAISSPCTDGSTRTEIEPGRWWWSPGDSNP